MPENQLSRRRFGHILIAAAVGAGAIGSGSGAGAHFVEPDPFKGPVEGRDYPEGGRMAQQSPTFSYSKEQFTALKAIPPREIESILRFMKWTPEAAQWGAENVPYKRDPRILTMDEGFYYPWHKPDPGWVTISAAEYPRPSVISHETTHAYDFVKIGNHSFQTQQVQKDLESLAKDQRYPLAALAAQRAIATAQDTVVTHGEVDWVHANINLYKYLGLDLLPLPPDYSATHFSMLIQRKRQIFLSVIKKD